jgi:hypothetical protein
MVAIGSRRKYWKGCNGHRDRDEKLEAGEGIPVGESVGYKYKASAALMRKGAGMLACEIATVAWPRFLEAENLA